MNKVLREQILAMAQQAGAEFYEGFLGSHDTIHFTAQQFEQFTAQLWQTAHDRGHDLGWDAGQAAAESSSAFEARNAE
jgi:hypothetical protein